MFMEEKEKGLRERILSELLDDLDDIDDGKGERFGKKPMAAEVSVTEIKPEMEEEGEGMDMEEGGSSPSPEDIAMIKELYNKYCC